MWILITYEAEIYTVIYDAKGYAYYLMINYNN